MNSPALLKKLALAGAVMLSIVGAQGFAIAAEHEDAPPTRWATARLHGMITIPLGDNRAEGWNRCNIPLLNYLDFYSSVESNSTGGVLAGFEYVLAEHYGLALDFVYWRRIVDIGFTATGLEVRGSPNFVMPILSANYHIPVSRRHDLRGGPIVGLGVLATGGAIDNLEVTKDFALGLGLGFDYYLDDEWSLGASFTYVDFGEIAFSVLPSEFQALICDSGLFGLGHMRLTTFTVGVGYRFR